MVMAPLTSGACAGSRLTRMSPGPLCAAAHAIRPSMASAMSALSPSSVGSAPGSASSKAPRGARFFQRASVSISRSEISTWARRSGSCGSATSRVKASRALRARSRSVCAALVTRRVVGFCSGWAASAINSRSMASRRPPSWRRPTRNVAATCAAVALLVGVAAGTGVGSAAGVRVRARRGRLALADRAGESDEDGDCGTFVDLTDA